MRAHGKGARIAKLLSFLSSLPSILFNQLTGKGIDGQSGR